MRQGIDQLLVILSLDCFTNLIWDKEDINIVEKIKEIARDEFKKILNGSSNYYMNADFSADRLKKTHDSFYSRLEKFLEKIQKDYIKSIHFRIEDKVFSKINEAVTPILIDLLWLNQEKISQPISNDLLEILYKIENSEINIQEIDIDDEEIEHIWKESNSEWDRFMRQGSMFEDIDDMPCLILSKALRLDSATIFLRKVHAILDHKDFSKLLTFLIKEVNSNTNIYNSENNKFAQTTLESYLN